MSTPKTVTTRGELSCWTTTKTERGRLVRSSHFDVPVTGDRLADDTAAARVMLELVRLVRPASQGERWRLRYRVMDMLHDAFTTDTDAAKAFRYLVAEVVLAGIVHADSEPWALAELRIAEERSNAVARAFARERAEFIERMKAGRAAKRQREAVQVLCRWPGARTSRPDDSSPMLAGPALGNGASAAAAAPGAGG